MQLSVLTAAGKLKKDGIKVNEAVFECELKPALVHQVVQSYLYNGHNGTKAQKTRSDVRGGGKKPFRQKGTGRARAGTTRSPLWRSGGVTFATKPHVSKLKINKQMFRRAITSILSQLVREERLMVIKPFKFEKPKTKDIVNYLKNAKLEGSVLFVIDEFNEALALSIRNIPNVDLFDVKHIDPANLIAFDHILVYDTAIKKLEEGLSS